ncbi:MAG: Formamidopyrimidine-DNA glycosylase [Candidatus Collierbacteria bacterium GW2011_GWA2_44_99]|uniref:Formamidopyrimidine-DNA glycosylase n=1 Tax=Candidatus Collierbacteria bacterium GW2011_GWA2_44_99 TaxID=1618380 RepID=A0A0G1KTC6_9BACT|nr:MAG: Formamidopyrimidine-DNA glycosylase [Candidatus Collierbacteria bacterium GW2011_GWA2_44_99]
MLCFCRVDIVYPEASFVICLNYRRWKDIQRKSKVIEVSFEDHEKMVTVHLKMTGQLVFVDGEMRVSGGHPTADWVNGLHSKHTRVVWTFDDGSKLFFNDMRVFGWMKLVERTQELKNSRYQVPDVIDKDFTEDYLFNSLKKTKKPIKLILLDQNKIGGLGNIYVNDALFMAGVRPERKTDTLEKKEVSKLHKAIVKVINLGIKYGGASASNYVQVSGLGGTYQDHFLVYKREGLKCRDCESKIQKIKLGGRGTFFCPSCQK